jgi:gliding motility-associated-like protein/uncharacterized repeat protein (TIGR01451 family)
MKQLYKIIVICALLIVKSAAYSQSPVNTGGYLTFSINEGASIVLHGGSDHAAAYQWFKNGIKIDGAVQKDYIAKDVGIYTVIAYNTEGCPSLVSDEVRIIVNPPIVIKPDTAVDLTVSIKSSNIKASPGDSFTYLLTANNNSPITGTRIKISYTIPDNLIYVPTTDTKGTIYDPITRRLTWSIDRLNENDPVNLVVNVKVLNPGLVQSVVNIAGKEHDPIMANNVDAAVQQVYPLVISNVFTPNGDGINDTFVIPGLETYSDTELSIINRWGNTIYQKTNYKNDWDGQGMVEGTYFYVLKAKNKAGVWDTYKGYITLLRTRI